MSTELKRFTISITPAMEDDLDAAKKEHYYKETNSEMIRDLIVIGLNTLNSENEIENSNCQNST